MWATALDAHTNFSVMVDRVTSRFSRAEEVWILRERGRDKLGEISGRLSRFTRRLYHFRYLYRRQATAAYEFELHSSGPRVSVLSSQKSDIAP